MRAWLPAAIALGFATAAHAEEADTTATTAPTAPRPRVAAPT